MIRKAVIVVLLFLLSGCTWAYVRLSYGFVPFPENTHIMYEPGAEDLAKLAADNFAVSVKEVERRQYLSFKDKKSIRVYVFNDRERYARFSHASIRSRGSSTTNEVYLSEKLREKIDTFQNILVHELSHIHIRQYTGTFKYIKDIPGWFLEGLAVVASSGGGAESVTREQARTAMRKAVQFKPDESGSIFGHKYAHNYGLEPHMYYRQAGLFVEYLNKSSPDAFKDALVDILNGDSFRDVWPKYYGRTISELWSGYTNSFGA